MKKTREDIMFQINLLIHLVNSHFGCGEYQIPTDEDVIKIYGKIRELRLELNNLK